MMQVSNHLIEGIMPDKYRSRKLMEPLKIRNSTMGNRIAKSAQWFLYAEPDGSVGKRIMGWYEALAKGGAGMVSVEESVVDFPLGASGVPHLRIDDDTFITGLSKLAEIIHRHNRMATIQITHAGPAHNAQISGMQPVAPSALDPAAEKIFAPPRELSVSEIQDLVEKFAQAALRAKKAGFDGIEVHMAHYGLANAFLSRIQNKRQDDYGCQNLGNCSRFSREILERSRELTGADFIIGVRMNGKEWGHELGTTNGEAIEFAKIFEKAGADCLHISAYGYGPFEFCAIPDLVVYPEPAEASREFARRIPTGALIPEAAAIKQAVSIPVGGVGHISYETADKLIEEGKVDFVFFGRPLMADPEFPAKIAAGREDDIRPCLYCGNCMHFLLLSQPVQCRVNAFAGNETEMIMEPAKRKKKVMIIGAGPAGLETARVAAERGHEVTLYDRSPKIGGMLTMAAFIKGREIEDLTKIIRYYRIQLKKLGVTLHLGETADLDTVTREKPDAVVLSVGGNPTDPAIPIKPGAHVITTEQLKHRAQGFLRVLGPVFMNRLTRVFLPVPKKVVIVGSDLAGVEAAEFLVKRGREVVIVDEAERLGQGMLLQWLARFRRWMKIKNITAFNGVKYEEITPEGIVITSKDGERKTITGDTVISVTQYKQNYELSQALEGKVSELHVIGDAKSDQPGYIIGAIHDGARTGLAL